MPADEPDVQLVFVTAPDGATAGRLARTLVEERLVACANIVPGVRSIYRWQGSVEDDAEVLLILKTRSDRVAELAARVSELHPYDLPEVIALAAAGGSLPYLAWVTEESADRVAKESSP